ncbi:stage III sporulation protein AA [Paenibacillus sp. 32352]|uniref:stage III sporulation protein AA n=1 Tax=Paenibacillus sp. 32352 TaxID=1969111 RepID=UPI0009AE2857|nr:stage III sporulation protein AA [Paenibacillus sp. 32352]
MHSLLRLFSVPLRQRLATLPNRIMEEIQEIRVREDRPLEVVWGQKYGFIADSGLCEDPELAYRPTRDDCSTLLEMLTQHSLYTFDEELRRGYITVQGGHRIGIAGRTVLEQGKVKLLKEITSFNIRIARELKGVGSSVLPYLVDSSTSGVHHTLIVSPPQQGKTTLIRDLARLISSGSAEDSIHWLSRGWKVGIVDERSEIAACDRGIPRFDLGPRTDVLDGCPKAEGMMMMIRSMSPEVLIVDEIGRQEDVAAIHEAIHAGIRVIATAHGLNHGDVSKRPVLQELLSEEVFERIVILNKRSGAGTVEGIYDAKGKRLELAKTAGTLTPYSVSGQMDKRPGQDRLIDWTGNAAFQVSGRSSKGRRE